jgi:quercetin dioxygenase-like cupin family protein
MKLLIALNVLTLAVLVPAALVTGRVLAASSPTTTALGLGVTTPYHVHGPTFAIDSKKPSQVATSQLTWPADSRTGWHYHPGLVFITVTSGSLTLFARTKSGCPSTTYQAGQTFLERPGQVVNVVNSGGSTAANVVTIIGIPLGQPARVDVPAPAGCPAL